MDWLGSRDCVRTGSSHSVLSNTAKAGQKAMCLTKCRAFSKPFFLVWGSYLKKYVFYWTIFESNEFCKGWRRHTCTSIWRAALWLGAALLFFRAQQKKAVLKLSQMPQITLNQQRARNTTYQNCPSGICTVNCTPKNIVVKYMCTSYFSWRRVKKSEKNIIQVFPIFFNPPSLFLLKHQNSAEFVVFSPIKLKRYSAAID